ncbi:unnamed protein product [Ostreobium quekettii]|uniref:Uncharacterized protein n=1 Tax=Ostreobium quekettii TaxID=121088 RepID=A0A8S1IQZ5_9CHLO|nr:unnamed protein product [Ostreobium quekettii]|eukprot:evm.model.scf_1188.3 EVM.evm.TU.scf_1188.3   scf_1188:22258-24108(+)
MMSQSLGTRSVATAGPRVAAPKSRPVAGKAFLGGAPKAPVTRGQGHRLITAMGTASEQVGSAYATALVELAQSKDALEAVHADVDALASILKENAAINEFLMNPVAEDGKKKEVLEKLAQEAGFNESTKTFLFLTVDKGRIDCLEEICTYFENQYCKLTDTQVATLRSAVKLEQEQQFLIAKKLQELTGSKNIKLKPVVDKSLIAGFVVEYGSSQIDLSVKGQLDSISTELESAAGV